MKKGNKTKRIKVKADLKLLSDPSDDNSIEKEEYKEKETNQTDTVTENRNIYHCPKCFSIPLINVKDNENKVILDCLKNHHTEMLFSEYMSSEFQKKINNIECSKCKKKINAVKILCSECQKVYCKDCLSSHIKNNPDHHVNNINKYEFSCPIHISKYTHYCFVCKKNLCDECVEDKHDKHQVIYFKNINLKNNELVEFKNNLEKENELLFKIKKIFNDTLTTLSNKFNDIISYKFLCLKYKNNIINTYETNDLDYQIMDGVNHLKFITKDLKIEPEMNELDIIYELFNFLDSIEYNDEYNNTGNNNYNMNINEPINFSNMDYRINSNNKIIFDSKNKIEESESEYEDNENENENIDINNNKKKQNENIKVEENEKDEDDNEEEDKKDKLNNKQNGNEKENEDNIPQVKKDYVKIIENNKKNENDIEKKNDKNIINDDVNKGLINQISPSKFPNKIFLEKIDDENKKSSSEKKENNLSEKIKESILDKKEEDCDDNNSNENEENIFIYKSIRHIPVNSEYSQNNLNEKENKEKNAKEKDEENGVSNENKEKEIKKKKKKIIKKKKVRIYTKSITESEKKEKDEKPNIKIKKKILKKSIPKEENKEEKEKKEHKKEDKEDKVENDEGKENELEKKEEKKNKEEEKEKEKGKLNDNIHIEINDEDSQEILNNNIDKKEEKEEKVDNNEEKLKDKEKFKNVDNLSLNEDQEKSQDMLSNDIFNDLSNDISNDNISNDYKIEEVHNYNQEENKVNKPKKGKIIKKKKKKKLNINKIEKTIPQSNKEIEIINIENDNQINENLKKSLRYINYNKESVNNISDTNKDNKLENSNNNVNYDEESSSKIIKTSTITKKLNFVNSDKEENEEESNKEKNLSKSNNINIQINENDISNDNENSEDLANRINKSNNIVNLNLKLKGDDPNQKSPVVKKRKKIKKKKYLISVDNKGNINPNIEEKQIKITKKTTLIRSRSKDKSKERNSSIDTFESKSSRDNKIKNKEINFKIYKNESSGSSPNYNFEDSSQSTKRENEINNIRKINKIKDDINQTIKHSKNKRKMKMSQGKDNAALLLQNTEEVYIAEKSIKKGKKTGLKKIERELYKNRFTNKSVDESKNRFKAKGLYREYNYDEMKYLMDRSNSYKKIKKYKKFSEREKINCIKFENGISCLLEINPEIFVLGNLIGDIIIINSHTYKEIQIIREHDGTIISLCLLNDKSILSCSADRKMLKIRVSEEGVKYHIEFVFHGYENYILKAIELIDSLKIITCSWDDKLFLWEKETGNNYKNTLNFNQGERVVDLLELNSNCFVSISENNELKLWNSENLELIDTIKNIKCNGSPNVLCKINDLILCVLDYHEIQLVDITSHTLVNRIFIDDGNLSCILKLKDNSILVAEDYNNDNFCVFYIKQYYYEDKDLKSISNKKDKFYKTNKNNDKEIRALIQFSNGIIVQGVTGEYNGKDSGDLFFYY